MNEIKGNKYKTSEIIILNKYDAKSNYYGYFEKNITELALRLALTQCNRYVKTNLFICDEPFDGSSKNNFSKIEELIGVFKCYYKFIMVITHDDRIIKFFNKRIRILKPNNSDDVIKNGYMIKCE